ncbi:MAG: hypothetical protein JO002_13445, partial [Burkholderiaceae bacterium]|nr:hypothetical protein [Burkholderiaceae bacterium]
QGDNARARELARLVLAHPDRGAEATIPAVAALEASGAPHGDPAREPIPLADCLAALKRQAEAAA